MGVLYLVATPIGNLEDVTLRSLRVLREVVLVLAEDTRTTRHLLIHHGIQAPLLSYTEHNHAARLPAVLTALAGADVALVSEAGMPGINDPGQALVATVAEAGHRVTGVPGPSAVPLAVALAGFPVDSFTYLGFLPHSAGSRRRLLRANAGLVHTLVAFETPHRLGNALHDIKETLGDRQIAVCRELTKLHEEIFRGTVTEAIAHFAQPRGEFTLVIRGVEPARETPADELRAFLATQQAAGATAREAVSAAVACFGLGRRTVYAAWQEMGRRES